MDKFKINFEVNKLLYELRIPEDFNWFIISRYNKENINCETDHLVYNGTKILLYGYYYSNEKIPKYYDAVKNEKIQKEFVLDLLNNIRINWFTLQILDKLDFDVKYLKRKYWKHYYFNNSTKYILMENFLVNERYEKSYDIFESKKNDKKVGNLYIKNQGVEVKIFPDNQINIQKLNKAKTYLKNKKI